MVLEDIRDPLKRGLDNAFRQLETRGIDMYRSAMTDRHTFAVRGFFRFFKHVEVETEQLDTIREAAGEGTIVYVMRHRSLLDYLFFNYLFLRKGVPLARYANEINMLPILPWGLAIRTVLAKLTLFLRHGFLPNPIDSGWMREHVVDGMPMLLFLYRRPTFLERLRRRRPSSEIVEELIEAQQETDRPILLVPLQLFWHRGPETLQKNILDIVFGESETPGPFRKVVSFLRNRRRAVARIGDPLNLQEFVAGRPGDERIDIMAKRVRWACLHYLNRESRVVTGARLIPVDNMVKRVLASPPVRAEIQRLSKREGKPPEVFERRAARMAYKIAADVRWSWLLVADRILTWVWNNIYSGVDVDAEGLKRVKEVVKDHPVVVIPSHKSHADYMILSYVFHHQGLNFPFIAAGENLSFWPMGKIFRRMGAFFIRRSFGSDKLYAAVFERYVYALMKAGQTLEFFIEGGRSRTGRILQPRLGLLGMIVRSWQGGVADDVYLVPVNITYETVIEEREFARELKGAKKEAESAKGLLRIWRVFRRRYGRVAVEVAEPISLRRYFGCDATAFAERTEAERRAGLKGLGDEVARGINEVAVVTGAQLIASALLAQGRRGSMHDTLMQRALALAELLQMRDVRFSPRLAEEPKLALERAIDHFVRQGALRTGEEEGERYYVIEDDERITLDLYKNMTLHYFAPGAFVATALLVRDPADADRRTNRDELYQRYAFLRETFRLEFSSMAEHTYLEEFSHALEWLERAGLIEGAEEDDLVIPAPAHETLHLLRGLVASLLEGYMVAVRGVAGANGSTTQANLLKGVMVTGQRLYRDGFVEYPESLEKPLLQNGIRHLIAAGALNRASATIERVEGEAGAPRVKKREETRVLEVEEPVRQEVERELKIFLGV